ncbi:MAG: PD40 domain-containing protein [Anaerolineae bacterium]|nr:PD40 domain-containing protein [Anaerolineae bacterium]
MKRSNALFSLVALAALVVLLTLSVPGAALGSTGQKGTPTPHPTKGAPPTATAQAPAPTSAATTGGIEVTSTLEMDLLAGPGRTAALLAPNGERFVHFGEQVCIYRVDGSQEACYTTPEDMRINTESVRWSPDSTRLAFMDNDLFRFFADTDIWTLDVNSGRFANLTDDGIVGGVILKQVDANLDYGPVWSPDGQDILFLRIVQTQGDTSPVTLYSIPADGGSAAARYVLSEYGRFRILGIALAPDGDTVAYFHDWRDSEDAMWAGFWTFSLSNPNPQRLMMIDYFSLPNEMAFSPDSANLLVTLRTGMAAADATAGPEAYPAWVVPVNGDAPMAIDAAHRVRAAAWREGSTELAYIALELDNPDASGLYIASGPGQLGQQALPGEWIGPMNQGDRMAWGANGVTLLAGRGGRPLVVVSTNVTSASAVLSATPTAMPVEILTVRSTLNLDLTAGPGGTAAILAPNGERFAHLAEQVCIYTIDGAQQACYDFPGEGRVNVESASWSPDSTRLVFMDGDLFRNLRDTDIWTLDADSGQFTNLTDDGASGGVILNEVDANLDYAPVWSPDGTQIAFLRSVQKGRDTGPVAITTIPADGGEAVARYEVEGSGTFRVMPIAWGPDGDTMAYVHYWRGQEDDALAGVWALKLSDPQPERIAILDKPLMPGPLSFSPDGANVLLTLASGEFSADSPEDFPAWVFGVHAPSTFAVDAAHIIRAAAWRQGESGSALAYIVFEPLNPEASGLYFSGAPGEPGELILNGEFFAPSSEGNRLTWAANGAILLARREGWSLVVVNVGE